jgi:hypothetical protein
MTSRHGRGSATALYRAGARHSLRFTQGAGMTPPPMCATDGAPAGPGLPPCRAPPLACARCPTRSAHCAVDGTVRLLCNAAHRPAGARAHAGRRRHRSVGTDRGRHGMTRRATARIQTSLLRARGRGRRPCQLGQPAAAGGRTPERGTHGVSATCLRGIADTGKRLAAERPRALGDVPMPMNARTRDGSRSRLVVLVDPRVSEGRNRGPRHATRVSTGLEDLPGASPISAGRGTQGMATPSPLSRDGSPR